MSERRKRWEIYFERQAEKDLRRLPKHVLERLDRRLSLLSVNPFPAGCTHLAGYNLYRVYLGRDWRLTYAVEEDRIIVVEVAPRGSAYKRLRR